MIPGTHFLWPVLVFSSGCVVRLVFCFLACAGLMPKKLSSVKNFHLFEHMIACLKAFENVAIKHNRPWHASGICIVTG